MAKPVSIIGAGLAGSEAALQLAKRDIDVVLYEMRPENPTAVHKTGDCAELVCSNSLKSTKPDSAAGMLKHELETLGSVVYKTALKHAVPAGGALAVNRVSFAREVTELIESESRIDLVRREVDSIDEIVEESSAVILATGPLTSDALASSLASLIGDEYLAF
ncbi:MAG: FAD-dependent oxidoreductase, partial [Eggerthellaceae bacterium]|nr:FAD-dependent oxidoreductase [Eggerthellaceae bacterium]